MRGKNLFIAPHALMLRRADIEMASEFGSQFAFADADCLEQGIC